MKRTKWIVLSLDPRDGTHDNAASYGPFTSRLEAQNWLDRRDGIRWNSIARIVQVTPP